MNTDIRDANIRRANERRQREAAPRTVAAARRALEALGDDAPPHLAAAGRLRIKHPQASLAELAALARPELTKDAYASRLRRLLAAAEQRERRPR